MQPGPKPKPPELKRLLGNPGRRPLPVPPEVVSGAVLAGPVPPYPPGLKKAGKTAWERLWRAGSRWLSQDSDVGLLVRLAEAWDEREELRRIIRREGRFARGSMGQTVTHPAVEQVRALETLITRYESLCGFTPSDRGRLGLTEIKAKSKLEEFLARRRTA